MVMAAADLDFVQLSSFTSLPQSSFTTLFESPTSELLAALLSNVSAKARDYDELKSQQLKLNVELENAIRGGETKSRVLKASVDKGQKEAEALRDKLEAEEKSRTVIESELETLKSSTASSASELSDAKARIVALESSNRDTLSLLESKSTAYDKLAEEVTTQHHKTIELRREVSNLEQSIQSANAISSNAKYHEQSLQQEIEYIKRNNDWLDKELKTKSADYTKYRKEKGNRIAELQRQNDEATSTIDSLSRTEATLRKRLEEMGQKADDSLSRIQQMEEQASRKDEAFRIELDAANRLAELMKHSADTEKARQRDLQDQLETFKEDASDQIGRIGAEVDTEHREREAAEQRVAELEVQVERLEAGLSTLSNQAPVHGASHHGVNGHTIGTPSRGASSPRPFSPGPAHIKGGLSLTQMYSDYSAMKKDFDAEKRRNEKLSNTIDEMIQDLESRQPEVEELRADHGRLEADVAEMSSLVDIIGKERDHAVKNARKKEGQVDAKIKEGEVLRQQLRDLSSQVKILLMEVHLRDQGVDQLSAERHLQLERVAQGQYDEESLEGVTDTDRLISENLVTFKNLAQLQEQNNNLIKLTRELGDRMEREEASRTTQDQEDLQRKYEQCKDEIKSLITQSQSYIRERDMFRRMLSHRGQLPPGTDLASAFGKSVASEPPATPTQNDMINSIEQSPASKDLSDYAKLLKDMQSHFDSYRQEAATDRSTLKEQVDSLSKTNSELRNEVGRRSSQVTLAHERYEMLQANYAMLKTENEELQKRAQFFSDNAAKQDLRTQQVVEDLVESKGLADSMRNELAILKAEKEWWRSVEKRLAEDKLTLSNEQSRLNSLNTSLQNLLNEKEHSDSEARRKLVAQAETLDNELQIAKRKLSEEVNENKKATLRREFEQQQSQKKIDDLVTSLSSLREEFVAVKTTRDHLQARVEELNIKLRNAEERVHLLQPSSTVRNGHESLNIVDEESQLTREQELAIQVSELRRDLELSRAEVQNVQSQVEQYKAISQASEEQLHSLNETQDVYRQETDKALDEKSANLRELQHRIDDLVSELSSTDSELSELRTKATESEQRLKEQRTGFETELAQLRDQDERHATAAQYHQEDLKIQAEIAQQAQQNYENELVKHAEAAKALQSVRAQLNEVRVYTVELKTEAESARTALSQSEESWADSKEKFERELKEVVLGKQNIKAQNDRLHKQLDEVTSQISSLRKRTSTNENDDVDHALPAPNLENLLELNKYVRQEKEIVDLQLELSAQESARLKQQLEYTQSQLDDTRLKLNQQRRLEEDSERTALNHKKLVETINELNTFRESSVTLRNETRQARASLAAKVKQIEELTAQIEPLQAELRELKNEKETQAGEMKLLQENCERWQQRAQNILQKYDRVDPAELEALKGQLQSLQNERDELRTSRQHLQEQVDGIAGKITQAQDQGNEKVEELRQRLTEQFKTRSKNLSAIIKEKDGIVREKDVALQTASEEKLDLERRYETLHAELKETEVQRDKAIEKASISQPNDTNDQSGPEEGQVDEGDSARQDSETLHALQGKLDAAETRAAEASSRVSKLQNEVAASRSRIVELEHQILQIQQSKDEIIAELDRLRNLQQPSVQSVNNVSEEQIEQLRRELSQAQQDAENLRATASVNTSMASAPTDDDSKPIAEQVGEHVEAIRAELETRYNERVNQLEENFKKRADGMRAQLTKKLADGKQILAVENEQVLETLRSAHRQELEQLKLHDQNELDELRRKEESQLTATSESLLPEHVSCNPNGENADKAASQETGRPWNPTEAEARDLVATNATVRAIVMRNIGGKVKEAKEALSIQLKAEHEKHLNGQLTDAREKAALAQVHAVYLEEKKSALKISMAENRFKAIRPKLDIVEKAAQETPQKPVGEVWIIAKDAKPIQQPQQDISKGNSSNSPGQRTTVASNQQINPPFSAQNIFQPRNFGQPPSMIPAQQANSPVKENAPQTGNFGQPTPIAPIQRADSPITHHFSQGGNSNSTPPRGPPVSRLSQGITQQHQSPTSMGSTIQHRDTVPSQGASSQAQSTSQFSTSKAGTQSPSQPPLGLQNNLPMKPPQGVTHHPNAGTGPGALRGLQQSSLPVARGGSTRGAANARGRGSGIARGAPQALDTSRQGQPHGRGSPTSGSHGGGARQFVPQGNKRPRDDAGQDGQSGGDGGNGKRIRGGGNGS